VNLLEKYNNDHDIYRPSVAFKTTTAAIIPHKLTEYYYTKQMSQSQTFVYVYGNRKLTPETRDNRLKPIIPGLRLQGKKIYLQQAIGPQETASASAQATERGPGWLITARMARCYAERGYEIACRPSVCLSVRDV